MAPKPDVQYNTEHPVYPVLQKIGKEITQQVKPKAVVVFSAHWMGKEDAIHVNNAVDTDLIYECVACWPVWVPADVSIASMGSLTTFTRPSILARVTLSSPARSWSCFRKPAYSLME